MLGDCAPIAFVNTAHPERARDFYQNVLGLTFIADEPYALVFRAGSIMLRIAKAEQITVLPYTVLGWDVPDIGRTAQALTSRGVVFERYPGLEQDALGIWKSPSGAMVAWFKDPDGNTLSLTQFA